MKRLASATILVFLLATVTAQCKPGPSPSPVLASPTATATQPLLTPTPLPQEPTQEHPVVVDDLADSGPGTFRQALLDAQNGDTITFDPAIFPPDAPVTIFTSSELPHIRQGNLMIDASNAGVILDGSNVTGDWLAGLQIVSSDANTIRGLQISNFSGPGIAISGDAQYNTIGGDRRIGTGPFGQGNLFTGNDVGISLSSVGTSLNTITGNLIGTDAKGVEALGNQQSGVWISEGANRNTIGPGNIIAYNGGPGIGVEHLETVHNTITRNSIHDNGGQGIVITSVSQSTLQPPLIINFNLQAGTVSGFACANCTVEMFSDSSDEGAFYEGRAIADSSGVFTLSKGDSFKEPQLTAYATDPDGNTSQFSFPTTGVYRTLSLQQNNNLPLTLLAPKPSYELLDNHSGVHFEDFERYSNTGLVYTTGFKWVRIHSLTEFWGEGIDVKTFSLESIPPSVDSVISEYAANKVNVILDLWIGAGLSPQETTFQSEEEVSRFSDYVRFVVSHFKDRIGYYEIWNEPGNIAVPDYAELVRQVVPIIREEDPRARVIIGAIPGSWEDGYPGYGDYQRFSLNIDQLNEILLSGVAPLVDGISWHPFYDNIPSDPYYQGYPQMLKGIKELATSQGFTGEYFADELLWRTVTEEGFTGGPPLSPLVAAKHYARAILMHRGLGVNVTINIFFQESALWPIHNLNDTLAGAEPIDITLSVAGEVANLMQYAFSLPSGDNLVALWTNGEAVEDDPGVSATLTFPGTSAQSVIGIDVLHGFEQQLVTETEDGSLIIRNLLVKDYPIILRLTD